MICSVNNAIYCIIYKDIHIHKLLEELISYICCKNTILRKILTKYNNQLFINKYFVTLNACMHKVKK